MLIVGIDAGEKGGVAALEYHATLPGADRKPRVFPLPVEVGKTVGKGSRKKVRLQLNRIELVQLFRSLAAVSENSMVFVIEEPPIVPYNNRLTIASLFRNYGEIRGIAAAMEPRVPLLMPGPKVWKKAVLSGTSQDKAAAINYVRNRYPDLDIRNDGGKPHDGYADAVCIAEYGIQCLVGGAALGA
jgi:hypothetical protein